MNYIIEYMNNFMEKNQKNLEEIKKVNKFLIFL